MSRFLLSSIKVSRRKMMQFSAGVLCLLLPWFGGPVTGELSDNFSKCLNFFYHKTPPQGISGKQYQPICQSYKDKFRFASLYHRPHRTPLYSAYILKTADGRRPKNIWMYEPQLVSPRANRNMQRFSGQTAIKTVMKNQAVLQDYNSSGYTKGHLNPSSHQRAKTDREATFTLTNIVPQTAGSNGGSWNRLENKVLKEFKQYCKGSMYVITGVMPYKSGPRWINNRVAVPEYMWSAYCCPSYSTTIYNLPRSRRPFFPTYAAVGRNDPNSGDEIVPVNAKVNATVRGYDVRRMPLVELEKHLRQRLGMNIKLFDGQCQKQG